MAYQSDKKDSAKKMNSVSRYLKQMKTCYSLAKDYGPLSDIGSDMLLRAESVRREYEERNTPLLTAVTPENSEAFADLISDDVIEDINTGKMMGLGILRTEDGASVPVGACAYKWIVLPKEVDEKPFADIRWIFVEPGPDEKDIADQLIAEMIILAMKRDASALTAGLTKKRFTGVLAKVFDEWNFYVSEGIDSMFRCKISDIGNNPKIEAAADAAIPLGTLSVGRQRELIKRYMKQNEQMDMFDDIGPDPGYYDGDISCFVGTEKDPKGLLLVHKKPSGLLVGEFFDRSPESGISVLNMLSSCIDNAAGKYSKKTEITFFAENEAVETFLDKLIPVQRAIPMVEAVLNI